MKTKTIKTIKVLIKKIEKNLAEIKVLLGDVKVKASLEKNKKLQKKAQALEGLQQAEGKDEKVIQGIFNGQNMLGQDGREYPIPPNYASKSKLVEGDVLKLTIQEDGSFIYKQINPVERKKIRGTLSQNEKGDYIVLAEGKSYKVLLASITYFKGEVGDEVVLIVPKEEEAEWGAVESIIKSPATEELSLQDLKQISNITEKQTNSEEIKRAEERKETNSPDSKEKEEGKKRSNFASNAPLPPLKKEQEREEEDPSIFHKEIEEI